MKKRRTPDPYGWTGEPDPASAVALAIALLVGAIGFFLAGVIVSD